MNNIRDERKRTDEGCYDLTLEMSEADFFEIYEDVDSKSAEDLVRNYLVNSADDARFRNLKINYNKNAHRVTVTGELLYDHNMHTDYQFEHRGQLK